MKTYTIYRNGVPLQIGGTIIIFNSRVRASMAKEAIAMEQYYSTDPPLDEDYDRWHIEETEVSDD